MIFFNFYVLTAGVTHGITFTLMDFKHQKYETFVSAIVQRIVNKQTVVNRIVVVLTETEILCMCWCDHHFSFIYGSIKHHHKKNSSIQSARQNVPESHTKMGPHDFQDKLYLIFQALQPKNIFMYTKIKKVQTLKINCNIYTTNCIT